MRVTCAICEKPMGDIRDATLRRGFIVMCRGCLERVNPPKCQSPKDESGVMNCFKDIFK